VQQIKTLHLASFDGNIGDNANHFGFYKKLKCITGCELVIDQLEIREFYWKKRFFDKEFAELANSYDLVIVGGGNYFELWVENSPTGTSIAIELDLYREIKTPFMFNALGVDPGQGASVDSCDRFRDFLDLIREKGDFVSIRNDGAKKALSDFIGESYLDNIVCTVDAGFFVETNTPIPYFKKKNYIAINVASDMEDVRFPGAPLGVTYKEFLSSFKNFITEFTQQYEHEVVFVPHIYRDLACINDILNELGDDIRRQRVSVGPLLHGEDSYKDVMNIYAGADVVFASRFHANICSIGLGVPTVGLANYRQIRELYSELGSSNYIDVTQEGFEFELLRASNEILNTSGSNAYVHDLSDVNNIYESFLGELQVWIDSKFSAV
jgi:polysaccharide pyruvyl transferase WcaK-like protein